MILGYTEIDLIKLAMKYQSSMTDGVVQYDYEEGKAYGCGFTTGTLENPENPVFEIFRLSQGETLNMNCEDCPFIKDGEFDEEMVDEYGETRHECCASAYSDDFTSDYELELEQAGIELRDVLKDYLGETLSKLNEIRIGVSDILAPYDYMKVRSDNWEFNTLDSYVDNAMEYGINITETDAIGYLDDIVQNIASVQENPCATDLLREVGKLVESGNLDGALELLQ